MSAPARRTKSTNKESGSEKTLAKLPAKETSWVRMTNSNGDVFIVTATPERTIYFLYQVVEDGFKRIAKSTNPRELDTIVYPPEAPRKTSKPKK